MKTTTKVTKLNAHYQHWWTQTTQSVAFDGSFLVNSTNSGVTAGIPVQVASTVTYGENYPDWRSRIAGGLNATTELSGDVYRIITAKQGSYHAKWKEVPNLTPGGLAEIREDSGYGFMGISDSLLFSSGSEFPSLSLTTADNRALARYNDKVASVNRQFQGGVFFGELAEALHGIRHPAEALFKGIESYSSAATKLRRRFVKSKADFLSLSRNRRRKVARSFAEAAGGLWLERSFHWLPLLGDIRGAVSAVEHTLDKIPRQFIRVSATDVKSQTFGTSNFTGPRVVSGVVNRYTTVGTSVKYYGIVQVGPRTSFVPDMKALGFDPRSFLPTIWELIPYSWAVDYFTNIGDMIYGLSYGGSDVMWTARGTKKFTTVKQIGFLGVDFSPPTSGWHYTEQYANAKESEVVSEHAQIARATYTGSFIPGLEYQIPGLSLKWLNLGAVFLQRSAAFL